jgi:AraC-like DNA-binding protein
MIGRPAYLIGTPVTADALRSALDRVRIEGAFFLRAEYHEAWAYESLSGPDTAEFFAPGNDRLAFFHVVALGRCWVEVEGEKHWADAGDVVVLPYGHQHRMGGREPAEVVPVSTFIPPPPWTERPVVRHGQDGGQTDVVCGYLLSDDALFDPALQVFPPVFVVRPPPGPVADWVRANIDYAVEQTRIGTPAFGGNASRLPELLLVEVLQLHLASAPAATHGLLAALRDPVLSRALALVHAAPERKWSVPDLAAAACVSRSLLDDRFRSVLGTSPMRYVAQWRLHVAQDLLASSDLSVCQVSRRVGYDAEEAFSRAFKREFGTSPGVWRLRARV